MTYQVTASKHKSVLELTNAEAQDFFLKGESYFSIELPPYFAFDGLISAVESGRFRDRRKECRAKGI